MFDKSILLVALVSSCHCDTYENEPIITTGSGKIRGHYLVSPSGIRYAAYEGIPYAVAPLQNLRFEPPLPVHPWPGELLANATKRSCLGFSRASITLIPSVNGVEDCLYLNIYVPGGQFDSPLPVLFWIYGGGFQRSTLTGSEQDYPIERNVIFVSFNHRHGLLGFLSTDDGIVSGNMGLKDQALALKWIYDNVRYFGGDPRQINLIGLSSGAASVHYHYLSRWTTGMFRSGISISGTALSPWAQVKGSRAKAVRIGEIFKCPTKDTVKMIDCLKKQPAEALMIAQSEFYPWNLYDLAPFGPVVEKFNDNPFIDRTPIDIINSGKAHDLPWITGIVKDEGLLSIAGFITNNSALQELDKNWDSIAPDLLHYKYLIPQQQHSQVARQIRRHYFAHEHITSKNIHNLVRMITDRAHAVLAERAVRAQAKTNSNPTRFYYYTYKAANSLSTIVINRANATNFEQSFGPSHADDVFVALNSFPTGPPLTNQDLKMHEKLIEFWISVTKTGSPSFVSVWPKVDDQRTNLNYLRMAGAENFKSESFSNLGEKRFWETINLHEK